MLNIDELENTRDAVNKSKIITFHQEFIFTQLEQEIWVSFYYLLIFSRCIKKVSSHLIRIQTH